MMMNIVNANYSSKIATSKPYEVFLEWNFWKKHFAVILFLFASFALIYLLWDYTKPSSEDSSYWSYLSVLIFCLAGLGLYKAIWFLAEIEIESEYCQQVESSSLSKIRQMEGGNLLMNIKELPSILPLNSKLITSRLFDHIITEAKARKFESNLITLQPYKEESFGGILEISNLQRIALLTGILGTFIGLVVAFRELDLDEIEIAPISNALQFSFGTSIAGLETAIILGACISLIRTKQVQLFHIMEKASDTLISLARKAINKDEMFVEFDQLRNAIVQLSDTVESQNQEVRNQTGQIIGGIDRLAVAKEDFNGFLNNLSNQETQFLKEVRNVHHYLSPEVISEELKKNLGKSVEEMSAALQQNLQATLEKYNGLHEYIVKVNQNLTLIEASFTKHINESEEVVLNSKTEIYKTLQDLSTSQDAFLSQISNAHLSEQIKESILTAGGDIAKRYSDDLKKMLPHVQNLEKQIGKYNNIAQHDISQRTPPKIALQILNMVGLFFISVFTGIIDGGRFIIQRIKNKI